MKETAILALIGTHILAALCGFFSNVVLEKWKQKKKEKEDDINIIQDARELLLIIEEMGKRGMPKKTYPECMIELSQLSFKIYREENFDIKKAIQEFYEEFGKITPVATTESKAMREKAGELRKMIEGRLEIGKKK